MVVRVARRAREAAARIAPDTATIAGGSIFVVGLWMVYDALAVMVAGLLIAGGGLLADIRRARRSNAAAETGA